MIKFAISKARRVKSGRCVCGNKAVWSAERVLDGTRHKMCRYCFDFWSKMEVTV